MMTVKELVELSLGQLCNLHKEFFVSRIAIGMSYHSGTNFNFLVKVTCKLIFFPLQVILNRQKK